MIIIPPYIVQHLNPINISHTLFHNISLEFYRANIISAGEKTEAQADKATCPPWLLRGGGGGEERIRTQVW